MARISATPNPVGVYSATAGAPVTIEWDTELRGVIGTVKVLKNGTTDDPVEGQSPAPSGSVSHNVKTPNTYRVALIRSDNQTELASVFVTTFDLRQQLAAGFSQAYIPQLRPQMITNLVVQPGIDTVRIAFRTTRPTIPTTELRDDSGAWVDGRMPLFGGLRTRHEAVFGIEKPLALNKKHSFRIEAFGPTATQNPNDPNENPNKAVVTGEFITGRRHVDVMWEMLDIHDDSDPFADGEFYISYGVGDVETQALLASPGWLIGADISDDDPPIDLGETMSLTDAPRKLWLQFTAADNDQTLGIAVLIDPMGLWPTYAEPGGRFRGAADEERATLTIHVDVDTDPGRSMIPFELRTGDWPVDFVVTGHLGVHAFVGSVISTKIGRLGPPSQSSAFLTEPGSVASLAVAGVGERTDVVALGADGAFHHRPIDRERNARSGPERWTRVELPGRGTPAVVASAPDRLELIDLDERGGVIHCRFDPSKPKGAKWRKLGGNFRYVVPVVEPARKRAEPSLTLFGIADDDDLFVYDARGEGRNWARLGDRPVRAVAAVSVAGAALFAVGDNGALLHFEKRNGRWRLQELGRVPGKIPTQLLTVAVAEQADPKGGTALRQDLVIGAMSEDRQVRTLRWPDYPAGTPETRWQEVGSVQDLLLEAQVSSPKRRRSSSKTT